MHPSTQTHPRHLPEIAFTARSHALTIGCGVLAMMGFISQSWILLSIGICGWTSLLLLLLEYRRALADSFESIKPSNAIQKESSAPMRAGQEENFLFTWNGIHRQILIRGMQWHHSKYIQSHFVLHTQTTRIHTRVYKQNIYIKSMVPGSFALYGVALQLTDGWSLFKTSRYIATPLSIRVLPKIPLAKGLRIGQKLRTFHLAQSGVPQKRIGTGTELHDIREYRAGDARRLISWKHSLRHRKWMCRDFETEAPLTSYLLLDIGQSMREGRLGERALDHAHNIVSTFTKIATEQRDPVGLISFDGSIFKHERASTGKKQLYSILRHLEQIHHITERTFANITIHSLCSIVNRFLWDTYTLASKEGTHLPSSRQSVEYIWDYIQQHETLQLPPSWESDQELIDHILRIFCQHKGIEIPYRYHQWTTYKSVGLNESLDVALGHMKGGQLIVVISDLNDILHWGGTLERLRRARYKRHHVIFLSPFSPWFSESHKHKGKTNTMLNEVLLMEQWNRRKRIQKQLAPLGIPLLSIEPDTAPQTLLYHLNRLRQGGRL